MPKIIQINSSSDAGGGPQVMWDIVEGLSDSFSFFIVSPQGYFLERYRKAGFPLEAIRDKNFISIALQIRRVIRKENPLIIHLHGTRTAIWGRAAVIGLGNKPRIIYTLHGFHIIRRGMISRLIVVALERFLNRWTDVLVCVSQADKRLVLQRKTISADKIQIIRNGIELDKFRMTMESVETRKKELRLENKFILSAIGRLHPQKDFSTILKALRLVVDKIDNIKLLIIGDGPLRNNLEKEARHLNLVPYVDFLGIRKDVPVLIQVSDLVILSTNWEGLPLVPLEVGASRKPIITSDIESVRETVVDNKTGCLFKPGSAEDLADKIFTLYRSSDLRKKMGEEAFSFISEFFSKQRMVEEHKELYQNLLS